MRPHIIRGILLLLALSPLLAACAGGTAPAGVPGTPVTLPAPPALSFVEGCMTPDLENWLEYTDFLISEFINTANLAVNEPPEAQGQRINRMQQMREDLASVPAPDECAADVHQDMAALMDEVLVAFQDYANHEAGSPSMVVSSANEALIEIRSVMTVLQERFRQEILATQASSATTSPE